MCSDTTTMVMIWKRKKNPREISCGAKSLNTMQQMSTSCSLNGASTALPPSWSLCPGAEIGSQWTEAPGYQKSLFLHWTAEKKLKYWAVAPKMSTVNSAGCFLPTPLPLELCVGGEGAKRKMLKETFVLEFLTRAYTHFLSSAKSFQVHRFRSLPGL